MKKIIIGIIVLAVVVWGGVKLFGTKEEKISEPIKIGVILPLSVKAANLGENAKQAIDLAMIEINKTTPKIEVIYGDDRCDPKEAVSVYQLFKQQNVKFIIGPICSPGTLAVAPLAERDGVVLITTGSAAETISQAGDFIFRNHITMSQKTGKLAQVAALKFNSVATIYDQANDAYLAGNNIVVDEFNKQSKVVAVTEGFGKDATDFRTQLTKIKIKQPEAIYIGALMPQAAIIVNQMKELGISSQIISEDGFAVDNKFLEAIGKSSEGIIFATTDFNRENTNQIFWDLYAQQFGRNPDIFAAQSYDTAMILVKIIRENCNSGNSVCVKNSLYKIQDYPGVSGKTSFDQNGDVKKSVVLKTIKNGQFVKYEE